MRIISVSILLLLLFLSTTVLPAQSNAGAVGEVLIRRTPYGVPHIKAVTLHGAAFGLAWCELEDYGERVVRPLIEARGDLARLDGYAAIDGDFINQLGYRRTVETYHLLSADTRELLEGFAEGVNAYLKKNPDRWPKYQGWTFTGYDVAATTTRINVPADGRRFIERLLARQARRDSLAALAEEGSNAWAFAPSRTASGHAILVRNPHLAWNAGYYEAHLTVPGKLNFYGDFRIGGLFAIIGGFNERLGWSTTNNAPDLEEVYALRADPEHPDHYLIDGISAPLRRELVTAEFKNGEALSLETRELLFTPYGPVIHRGNGLIYVLKAAGDGEYRRGEQFTRMLLARNLEEWKSAMRLQAITSSNYTYADADGNIFYVWNAAIPERPHPSGGDTVAIPLIESAKVWSRVVPFDELPQLLNPPGGYLHNENDPFHFTNLHQVLRPEAFPGYFPQPRLRQRSQYSLQLIDTDRRLSLEEVVELKHSMGMLLADQVKDDLLRMVRATRPTREIRRAVDHLAAWDNSVRADSRGGVLFEQWWQRYTERMGNRELYAKPWSFDDPMGTPRGLADTDTAVTALTQAVADLQTKYGAWDLAWGDVHRLRHGGLDLPIGGGPGGLGCFRVLWFGEGPDGKQEIRGGDGWQLAVEFSDPPRAYSVLAYGQSNDEKNPHHTDQVTLFADSKMKRVAFTEAEIEREVLRAYQPGE